MNEFSALAKWYDQFSDREFYEHYAEFIKNNIDKYSDIEVGDILDLGCGTGVLSAILERRGYGMVCVDSSVEMLVKARMLSESLLLINQEITDFELYGTVQMVISTLDTLNYLQTSSQLSRCFSLASNYLECGGLFLFDINTKYRFTSVYGDKSFVYEQGKDVFVWQNKNTSRTHHMQLSLFRCLPDGSYERSNEYQMQWYHPVNKLKRLLSENGFEFINAFGSLDGTELKDTSEKAYIIAKKR